MTELVSIIKNSYLENNFVVVKPYTPELSNLIKPIFYENILQHLEIILDENTSKFNSYINYLNNIYKNSNGTVTFVCIDKNTGFLAGCTQLKYINTLNLKLEMGGTWYGKKFQGTGLNQNAKLLLFDFCFNNLTIKRIQFSIDSNNISSKKSMLKIGAKYEGHFRNNWIDQNGNTRDDDYFSIISTDWNETRNSFFSKYI